MALAPADGDDTQSDEEGKGGKGKKGKRSGQGVRSCSCSCAHGLILMALPLNNFIASQSKEGEQRGRARPRRPRYIPPTRMPGDPIPEGETQAPAVGFHNGVPGTTWGQDPAATDSSTQHPFHSRPPGAARLSILLQFASSLHRVTSIQNLNILSQPPGAPPGPPMMGPFSPEAYQQYMQQWMAAQQQYFPGAPLPLLQAVFLSATYCC